MGFFRKKKKTEEEIQQEKLEKEKELNDELNSLNEKYDRYIDKLHLALDDVIDYLKDHEYINEKDLIEEINTPRSYTSEKFEEALLKLRGHSTSLSTEEEEYIINLANRIS